MHLQQFLPRRPLKVLPALIARLIRVVACKVNKPTKVAIIRSQWNLGRSAPAQASDHLLGFVLVREFHFARALAKLLWHGFPVSE